MLQKSSLNLTNQPAKKYSAREKAVFDYLALMHPQQKTTKEIATFVFPTDQVFFPQTTIVTVLKSLQRKMAFNGEPLSLNLNVPGGPKPMVASIIERKQ